MTDIDRGAETSRRLRIRPPGRAVIIAGLVALVAAAGPASAETIPQPTRPGIEVRRVIATEAAAPSVRLVKDPRDDTLYVLKRNGDVLRVRIDPPATTTLYRTADHGIAVGAGLAIGPDGSLYLVGDERVGVAERRARIVRGVPSAGGRTWATLALTDPYPRSNTPFSHSMNGIAVTPDGTSVLVASGSRTDHGEEASFDGRFPGLRETGLTSIILRLPATATGLVLPNDRARLRTDGYLFAEGVRNTFDMAFAANGDLFGADNGPSGDYPEELNWLRPGRHYGFPWTMGGLDNRQQFRDYDPSRDPLLNPVFSGVRDGFWYNDPTFPPRPAIVLTPPIANAGPDADSFRAPATGALRDASALARTLRSFTAHRSPLGLVFDTEGTLPPPYRGTGFILGWTAGNVTGDAIPGPFNDAGEDLLHLVLTREAGPAGYRMSATRIVAGFNNPIDAALVGSRLYVLDYGETQSIWEVRLPGS
jgi:hypothetical protein